jgi:hypothetical protein
MSPSRYSSAQIVTHLQEQHASNNTAVIALNLRISKSATNAEDQRPHLSASYVEAVAMQPASHRLCSQCEGQGGMKTKNKTGLKT